MLKIVMFKNMIALILLFKFYVDNIQFCQI